MVKRVVTIAFALVIATFLSLYLLKPTQAESNTSPEIVIGTPPENAGIYIATKGGWKLIEFWHSSGGYWKATSVTDNGRKDLIISDKEAKDGVWTDVDFLAEKIYQAGFYLEYKIWHPQEVLNAISKGAKITPVVNVDNYTINSTRNMRIDEIFYSGRPPYEANSSMPEKLEINMEKDYLLIRAVPRLTCNEIDSFQESLVIEYPHKIPLVKTSFGSLSYAMYHHNGSQAGVSYSPDPAYSGQGIKSIEYKKDKRSRGTITTR